MTTLNSFHSELEKIYTNDALNKVLRKCQEEDRDVCMYAPTNDNPNGKLYYDIALDDEVPVLRTTDMVGSGGSGVNTYNIEDIDYYTTGNIYTYLVTNDSSYNNIDVFTQDLTDLSYALASNDFSDIHPDKVKQYRVMKRKRKELDNKMRELYENEYTDNQLMYDNSVYVNLAWTVLATSVLYYLFVKL